MPQEPTTVYVKERVLRCPVCEGQRFTSRKTLINTRMTSFFDVEWLFARQALIHICAQCGYVYWFLPVKDK